MNEATRAALEAEGVDLSGLDLASLEGDQELLFTPIQAQSSKQTTHERLTTGDGVDDMIHLDDLDLDAIMDNLRTRYTRDIIYTYIGAILVSVNAFKPIAGLYDRPAERFRGKGMAEQAPHLFALAERALTNLVGKQQNQSFVISGESGAGKTEAMKIVCRYLTAVAVASAATNATQEPQQPLVQRFLSSANDVIEAFGNAKTIHNANSSRFGKWIDIQVDVDGQMLGASISKYLLEKGRVVYQAANERSFHCFYYLLAGASDADREQLALVGMKPQSFKYLNGGGLYTIPGVDDKEKFNELLANMTMFTDQDKDDMKRLLAAILHIGQIEFKKQESSRLEVVSADHNSPSNSPYGGRSAGQGSGGTVGDVADSVVLATAAKLLGVNVETFRVALTKATLIVNGEMSRSSVSMARAVDNRDALAKTIYDRMFTWLVETMSQAMENTSALNKDAKLIGILDIFGFENFHVNSFEQFCINFANEHLQNFFTRFIFANEQAEYTAEEVPIERIEFVDNRPCIDLILTKNTGIQALLDEQSYFPQATADTLLEQLVKGHSGHPNFVKPSGKERGMFKVVHYAGTVTYTIDEFLGKNRDLLTADLMSLVLDSSFGRLQSVFMEAVAIERQQDEKRAASAGIRNSGTMKRRAPTISYQFKTSLEALLQTLESTSPQFVRCIKPNPAQVPDTFSAEYVAVQLNYAGVFETVRIRRQGFAVRYPYDEFIKRFVILLPSKARPAIEANGDPRAATASLLAALNAPAAEVCFGKTKLFLKDFVAGLLDTRLGLVQGERMRLLKEHVEHLRAEAIERKRREEEERRRAEEERLRREEEERLRIEEEHRAERERLAEEQRRRAEERRRREEERRRREEERQREEEERMAREAEERRRREEERRKRIEEEERRWADIQDAAMTAMLLSRAHKDKQIATHLELFSDMQRENTLRKKDRERAKNERETMRRTQREAAAVMLSPASSSSVSASNSAHGSVSAHTGGGSESPPPALSITSPLFYAK